MLVVIDPAIENYELLADNVLPGAETILLSEREDAIAQITAAIHHPLNEKSQSYDSIHLVVPNSPGILHFSSGDFSLKTLKPYVNKLQSWFSREFSTAVSPTLEPKLLLYGRRIGAGQSGTELMDTLSWLTGAKVIAAKNGDRWPGIDGERAELAFNDAIQQRYQGTFSV